MTRIVQFVALDSPEERLGNILESMNWTHKHVKDSQVERVRLFDGYWHGLMKYWGEDDLIVIEQDMLPLKSHIKDLTDCEYDFCSVPYMLRDGFLSVYDFLGYEDDSYGPTGLVGFPVPIRQNLQTQYMGAQGSGLGLVKFTKRAQELIDLTDYPVPNHHWSLIDSWISYQMKQINKRWHLHYPAVGHLHDRLDS